MKKISIFFGLILLLAANNSNGQGKFYTKTGKVSFFSSTSMEDIEANNKSVTVLLDSKTGDLKFAVLMKGFEFKKALMQEHFNKSYVESDKYPQASFKGQILNNQDINYGANGTYAVKVKGLLTIHGQSKDIETSGTVVVNDGKPSLNAVFNVTVADYKISIPKIYRNNIAEKVRVTVDCGLRPL